MVIVAIGCKQFTATCRTNGCDERRMLAPWIHRQAEIWVSLKQKFCLNFFLIFHCYASIYIYITCFSFILWISILFTPIWAVDTACNPPIEILGGYLQVYICICSWSNMYMYLVFLKYAVHFSLTDTKREIWIFL